MLAQELTSGGGTAAAQLRVAEQYVEVSRIAAGGTFDAGSCHIVGHNTLVRIRAVERIVCF